MTQLIGNLVGILGAYLALGVVFSLVFVFRGVDSIDYAARGASWRFRLMILPGCAIFWPWLAKRWATKASPKEERNPHRKSARSS